MIDADGDPVYLSASAGTITDDGNGVWSWSYDTSDGPANSQIITVSASDGNGGISEATFDLVVNNVAPTATFNAPPAVNEGDDIQLSLTGSYDPSSVDTAAGFQFAFDCGDGLGYGAWTSSNTGTCPTSGDGTRTVRGKTKDKDEGEAIYSAQIPVQDLAPLAAFTWNPAPQEEGFGVQFTDASTSYPDEIVSWLWDFGGQATSDEQHSGFTFMDNDEYQVCLTVTDDDGTQDTTCDQVIILDRTPTAAFAWSPEPQDEGSPVQFTDLSTSYPDGLVAWAWDFGDLDTSTDRHPAHSYLDDDVYTVCLTATDDDGSPDHVCHAVTINNIDPTVTLTGPISSDEGDTKSYIYTVSDPGTDTFELFNTGCGTSGELTNATFDSDTGSGSFDCTFLDGPATSDVSVTVNDDDGGIGTGSLEVIVNNIPPTINSITAPIDPLNVNDQPVTVEVAFSDPGTADTHEVTWDWADYTSDTHDGANSPAAQEHTYTEAGVYPVTVTVTDDDGGSDTVTYKFIVIYDPDDGFVTGGGWIWSEPGWCHLDDQCAEAEGKANFGFVSKYKKGAFVPTGNTEFNFKAGSLNYHSDSYDWLVVTGSDYAKFKGAGTINGEGDFKFMVWAGDGDPDTFRIRIWVEDELGNETDIYDNGFGEPIGGGNIVVHTR
jgi:PKD repeat protein